MRVGEFCNRDVIIVDRDTDIIAAAKLMRSEHVGDLVIVDTQDSGQIPVGILTDRDIVVELLATDVDLDKVSVGDAMSYELVVAREEDDLQETLAKMRQNGIRRVPVVNTAGALVGILTVDDLLEVYAEQFSDLVKLMYNQKRWEERRRP